MDRKQETQKTGSELQNASIRYRLLHEMLKYPEPILEALRAEVCRPGAVIFQFQSHAEVEKAIQQFVNSDGATTLTFQFASMEQLNKERYLDEQWTDAFRVHPGQEG